MPKPLRDEFGLIAQYFAPLARHPGSVELTDDVALLPPSRHSLVVKTDAIVSGVHFLQNDPPGLVARKALRVNLSDLAAKGAKPIGYLLALGLPSTVDEDWVAAFAQGLAADQAEFGLDLLGGDMTRSPGQILVSITLLGEAAAATPRRGGAKQGDIVMVSGTLGDGYGGLMALQGKAPDLTPEDRDYLTGRYRLPQPRLALGQALVAAGFLHAAMDISDGLVADLQHICDVSGLGARVDSAAIPLSPAMARWKGLEPTAITPMLTHGDDYELLVTAAPGQVESARRIAENLGISLTPIGVMEAGTHIRVIDADGIALRLTATGYKHF